MWIRDKATGLTVRVQVGQRSFRTESDRSGYVDLTIDNHELAPGWHEVTVTPNGGPPQQVPVMIVGDDVRFGIVSDIDDTVMITMLPVSYTHLDVYKRQVRRCSSSWWPMSARTTSPPACGATSTGTPTAARS